MTRINASRRRAEARRRRGLFRPQLQQLESRLQPGSVLSLPWSGLSVGGLEPDPWAPRIAVADGIAANAGQIPEESLSSAQWDSLPAPGGYNGGSEVVAIELIAALGRGAMAPEIPGPPPARWMRS